VLKIWVLPFSNTSKVSDGSQLFSTSIPGEPIGIPGTLQPRAFGFSFSNFLMSSVGT